MTRTDDTTRSELGPTAERARASSSGEQTIVLREDEIGEDLGRAIERLRADAATQHARILIVRGEPGLPGRADEEPEGRASPESSLARDSRQLGRAGEVAPLSRLGERLESLVDCLQIFSEEVDVALDGLEESAVEAPRAALQASVRRIGEILAWSAEVAKELRREARAASHGCRPCSVAALLREIAPTFERAYPAIRVQLDEVLESAEVSARAADLAIALSAALELTAARIGGHGMLKIGQSVACGRLITTIDGYGEPMEIDLPDRVARFRSILSLFGGTVTPGAFGPGAAGIVIQLPLVGERRVTGA